MGGRQRNGTPPSENGAATCLVVGHFGHSLDDLAQKLAPTRDVTGGYTELRTNSTLTEGRFLTHAEVFTRLCEESLGAEAKFDPFDAPHAGVVYLVDFLRRKGFSAEGLMHVSASMGELRDALSALSPKVVILTTTFYVHDEPVQQLVECVREHAPDALVIAGGPFVVSRALAVEGPEASLAKLGADVYIIDSQGEQALAEVMTAASSGEVDRLVAVPNLLISDRGGGVVATSRELEDNDQLTVRWTEFRSNLDPPIAFVRTARGCPFRCAFCNYPAMAGGQHGLASVESVCEELETLVELGVRDVAFVDDTFNVPLPRFKKLLAAMIERDLGLRWTSFFRCSNADVESFDLMAEAGCQAVFLGIESGDPSVLKAMNKAAKVDSYARGIAALTERGILTMASYVMGFPGETAETIGRTLAFIEENPTTFYNVQLYYHDKLAPIEQRRTEFGIDGSDYSWSHATMDWREAADWVEYAMQLAAGPIPLPLYGFSIWSLPYFMATGLARDQFVRFGQLAGEIYRESLAAGDNGVALVPYGKRFEEILSRDDLERSRLQLAGGGR